MKNILSIILLLISIQIYSQNYTVTYVSTCKNGQIQAEIASVEMSSAQKAAAKNELISPNGQFYYLGITASDIVDEASYKYNCHSYAWHLTEGNTNKVWINQTTISGGSNLSKYWSSSEGCFSEVSESAAQKIFYYSGDHSAIKSSTVGKYESKWGQLPLVRHNPTQVPYTNSNNRRYYAHIISGPDIISCSSTATYNFYTSSTWTVSDNLQIVSGQGTNTITVQAANGTSLNHSASVSINGIATKIIMLGAPFVTAINGPGIAGNGVLYFSADPIFPVAAGSYEWNVYPTTGVTITQHAHGYLRATFTQAGTYYVLCRSISPCTGSQTPIYKTVVVTQSDLQPLNYTISNVNSKQVEVSLLNDDISMVRGIVNYTLTRITTGATVTNGTMSALGGSLDFSNQQSGIYVLQIISDNQVINSIKFNLQ